MLAFGSDAQSTFPAADPQRRGSLVPGLQGAGCGLGPCRRAHARAAQRQNSHEWVIDGQKTWTSLAKHADWCFVSPTRRPARATTGTVVPAGADAPARGSTVRPIRADDRRGGVQ